MAQTESFSSPARSLAERLTEFDFQVLESSHPDIAAQRRREHSEALAKQVKADIAAARAREERSHAIAAPSSLAQTLRKEFPPLRDGESHEQWVQRNKWVPVPFDVFDQVVFKYMFDFLKQSNEKNKERNAKIEALERRCAELESQLAIGDARMKALESRPAGLSYEGVWDATKVYARGMFATYGGSVWHAEQRSVSCRPGSDPRFWRLAIKKGQDGKDLRASGQSAT